MKVSSTLSSGKKRDMEEKLREFEGRKIDVNCGSGASYRGLVLSGNDGILSLRDESDTTIFISIDRIIAITECLEPAIRPGFIG